ncbi:MAG: hypothetical protein A2516_01775 [Alphaproteobacteria bacterium RIFOXYD12_FULL_60_8]|nr:MAG: hypothetical protein A2516_01775 [Alphaproteobacteria bacterium RIFOXYD12_FULL_60_8]
MSDADDPKTEEWVKAPGEIPAGSLVYVLGDVHGRADLLDLAFHRIAQDAKKSSAERRVCILLGDVIDRGPESSTTVDMLLDPPLDGFQVITLLGNHEEFLMTFLSDPSVGSLWLHNGGQETVESYGVETDDPEWDGQNYDHVRDALEASLPIAHLMFFQGLKPFHREGSYYFAHAGVRPGVALEAQKIADLAWIREPFLSSKAHHGAIIVHGHSITRTPDIHPNRIGLDTGAYASGNLTCLVLEQNRMKFLKV